MVKNKAINIKKSMKFSVIIKKYPEVIEILLEKGMHCIGCPMSIQETLGKGAIAHGLDADKLVKEINNRLNKK